MKRREFIRSAGMAGLAAPFTFRGLSIQPMSQQSLFARLGGTITLSDKIMVFIELNGGNDGLNTLIPTDQYSNLSLHRPRVLIPEAQVLSLSGQSGVGFHPAMTELRSMFDNGLVSVVHDVGYPNQDYSHFRSMDIWMTASSSAQYLDTGWLGRMLEADNPGYPTGYPTTDKPDPLAIQVGAASPISTMGTGFPMGVSVSNPDEIYDLVNDFVEPAPATPYGDELTYIRKVMQNAKVYSQVIKDAATIGQNLSSQYPAEYENELADQLKIVARLINGGLSTQVYVVSIGGFDTHSEQIVEGDPLTGAHNELLRKVSQAIFAFYDDIQLMGKGDQVCGMTYSEFGRTIGDNESFGTDHGAAAPLFVFGKSVNPGIIGVNPVIPTNIDFSEDVPMQYDFRSVYASVLQDWFGLTTPADVLGDSFPILPIFGDSVKTQETPRGDGLQFSNAPNPVRSTTTITFSIPSGHVSLNLLDAQGRVVRKLAEGQFPAGVHNIVMDRRDLPAGTYYTQLRLNGIGMTRKMLVI
jgi:uncharacterized protein (DUF1501 family)